VRVSAFPSKSDIIIHFAHGAYQLAECLNARDPLIRNFQTFTPDETAAQIGSGHVFVGSGYWKNDFISTAHNLKLIQVCAAGFENYDLNAISKAGVRLSNSRGVNANAVSDHAMALILGLSRKIHTARDNQRAKHWRGMISDIQKREDELAGKTLTILGVGTIGKRLARRAHAFDMHVIGIRRNISEIEGLVDEAVTPNKLYDVLRRSDFVALTCPLTDKTANIIDANALTAMPQSAYLINVSRGGCVNQEALIHSLEAREIAGAGIDTTIEEPLDTGSRLWDIPNVILTSHTAGETQKYEDNVIDILFENLNRLWSGKTDLLNQIV
tara:strand:+ start:318 stop:1298 length:981 start_codon:yes stop_codon:yes gene_type:complete